MTSTDCIDARQPPRDWRTPLELLALGAIWGGSFLFMRVAAADFGPVALVEVRIVLGALILLPFLWQARSRLSAARWWRMAAVGVLNSAIPFTLFAWGAERAPAGIGAIANSMTVLFTAAVGFVVWRDRIGSGRVIALIAGFIGVVVLASGRTAGANIGEAAAAGTLASFSYGIAANLTKRKLGDIPPVVAVAGTLGCAAILLAPALLFTWPATMPPAKSWMAATMLGVVCTGIAYVLFFRLIGRVGAARATTCTYLIPLFGVGWAWLLLGEVPTWTMLAAATLILGSVILSQREVPPPAAAAAVAAANETT
ncbi:MAG: DMT family transporter [Rudaea sp.]|nr:DMT family transporter [Rudaea sp.]